MVKFLQEKRRKEEEAEAQIDMQLAQEAAHAKMARDLSDEVVEFSTAFHITNSFESKLIDVIKLGWHHYVSVPVRINC